MAATREDLRDHLTAVIEAARELPKEDRTYLADSFLDDLEKQYQLVPRSRAARRDDPAPGRSWFAASPFLWVLAPIGLLFLLPFLLLSVFVLIHPPVLFLALIVLLLFRFGRPGRRAGGSWGYGPRGRHMSRYNL